MYCTVGRYCLIGSSRFRHAAPLQKRRVHREIQPAKGFLLKPLHLIADDKLLYVSGRTAARHVGEIDEDHNGFDIAERDQVDFARVVSFVEIRIVYISLD